jgi:hypothetical protein
MLSTVKCPSATAFWITVVQVGPLTGLLSCSSSLEWLGMSVCLQQPHGQVEHIVFGVSPVASRRPLLCGEYPVQANQVQCRSWHLL